MLALLLLLALVALVFGLTTALKWLLIVALVLVVLAALSHSGLFSRRL